MTRDSVYPPAPDRPEAAPREAVRRGANRPEATRRSADTGRAGRVLGWIAALGLVIAIAFPLGYAAAQGLPVPSASDEAAPPSAATGDAANDGAADGESAEVITTDAHGRASEASGVDPRTRALIGSLSVFVLAVFVGFEVITKVPPTLHTPLMSGANAISGIAVLGAIVTAGQVATHAAEKFGTFLGFVAVVLAMVNVVGGFMVTYRMLLMFKKR